MILSVTVHLLKVNHVIIAVIRLTVHCVIMLLIDTAYTLRVSLSVFVIVRFISFVPSFDLNLAIGKRQNWGSISIRVCVSQLFASPYPVERGVSPEGHADVGKF